MQSLTKEDSIRAVHTCNKITLVKSEKENKFQILKARILNSDPIYIRVSQCWSTSTISSSYLNDKSKIVYCVWQDNIENGSATRQRNKKCKMCLDMPRQTKVLSLFCYCMILNWNSRCLKVVNKMSKDCTWFLFWKIFIW